MKKILSLILALTMVFALSAGVFADDGEDAGSDTGSGTAEQGPKPENQNQCASVLKITEGTQEFNVFQTEHLKEPELMEILETAEEGIIPEDAAINHLTMIRQRDVVNEKEEPIEISLRSWGPERYLVVIFRPVDSEEWIVLACDFGNSIDATLPGNGQYVLAWSW